MTSTTATPSLLRRIVLLAALTLAIALPIAASVMASATFEVLGEAWGGFGLFLLAVGILEITAASVGVVILWRTSGTAIGTMLVAGALLLMSTFLMWPLGAYRGAVADSTDIIGGVALWWSAISILAGAFLLFPGVGILFPDGRLPSPRWRLPFLGVVTMLAVSAILQTIAPWPPDPRGPQNPFAVAGVPADAYSIGGGIGAFAVFIAFGLAVLAVSVRFRRSVGVERAQLKWLVASVTVMAGAFPVSFGTDLGPADLIDLLSVLAGSLIPIAIGVAVLRYRLYEIDRIISRSIAYAVVTGILAAVFGAVILLLQAVFATLTQGQTIAVAASTLAVFALFQPLLRRVRRAVDRRFDRARYDAERTGAAFSERLRDEVDMATVTADLARTTETALAPSILWIWLRTSGQTR
ncbi:MAG: hypothetical protein ABI553_05455 [Chloroflexota bacterium]